ncbi:MAG TPA: hypothetical protein HA306_10335, partial [Methanosarcina sp.]|nr:hypothetical protein [Methanosarcina sp.]
MNMEDKTSAGADKSREFGVFGDLLRELQREESKDIETDKSGSCNVDVKETDAVQCMLHVIKEINESLKEIVETQKKILKEIQKKGNV